MKTTHLPESARHFDALPDTALIPFNVLRYVVGRSRASVYRDVDAGLLPRPIKAAGEHSQNLWNVGDLRRVLQARSAPDASRP